MRVRIWASCQVISVVLCSVCTKMAALEYMAGFAKRLTTQLRMENTCSGIRDRYYLMMRSHPWYHKVEKY